MVLAASLAGHSNACPSKLKFALQGFSKISHQFQCIAHPTPAVAVHLQPQSGTISHNRRHGGTNEASTFCAQLYHCGGRLSLPPKPKIILGVRWWIWAMKSSIADSTVLNSVQAVSAAAAIRASKIIPISHPRRRASVRKTHLLKFLYRPRRKHSVIQLHGRPPRELRPGRG